MGWSYRKSFKAGPVRLNVSKSGLGVSAGVKGLRVSTGPRGTNLTAGRGGLRYTKKLGGGSEEYVLVAPRRPGVLAQIVRTLLVFLVLFVAAGLVVYKFTK